MSNLKIGVKYLDHFAGLPRPAYQTPGAAGLDLLAAIDEDMQILPGESTLIETGISISLPMEYEAQVRPRSGLALKYGLTVLNTPGTIDADYRGEIKVIMINLGKNPVTITRGMRIAQLIVSAVVRVELCETEMLDETERSSRGFGHTGIK